MNNHFLGLRLTTNTTERLLTHVERLRAWNLPANWVNPEDFHITLAFLGPLTPDEAQVLPSAIDLVASSLRQPTLYFAGIGARAGRHEPRAVFAALHDEKNTCRDMHDDLMDALGLANDKADEKPFVPHVTLCRPVAHPNHKHATGPTKNHTWQALFTAFAQTTWGRCECDELAFYSRKPSESRIETRNESRSINRTKRYQILASWSLIR